MSKNKKMRDVLVPRKEVTLANGDVVDIRGINASDMMMLVTMFGPQIVITFAQVKEQMAKGKEKFTQEMMLRLVTSVAQDAPKLIGWLIAVANDDPDEDTADHINSFPIIDQVSLLNEVVNQTFANEGTVRKLTESLSAIYLTISGATMESQVPQNRKSRRASNSQNGTGV
jgi:hypothetical protein